MATVNLVLKTSTEGDGLTKTVADLRQLLNAAKTPIQIPVPDVSGLLGNVVADLKAVTPETSKFVEATNAMAVGLGQTATKIDQAYAQIGKATSDALNGAVKDIQSRSADIDAKVLLAFDQIPKRIMRVPIVAALANFSRSFVEFGKDVGIAFRDVGQGFVEVGVELGNIAARSSAAIARAFKLDVLASIVSTQVMKAANAAKTAFSGMVSGVTTIVSGLAQKVGGAVANTAAAIYYAGNNVQKAATFVATGIGNAFTAASNAITTAKTQISTVIAGVGTVISAAAAPFVAFKDRVVATVDGIKTKFTEGMNTVKTTVSGAIESVKTKWAAITAPITSTVESIKTKFTAVKTKLAEAFAPIQEVATQAFAPIVQASQTALTKIQEFASGMQNSLNSASQAAQNLAMGGLDKVVNATQAAFQEGWNYNNQIEQASAKLNAFTKDNAKTAEILDMVARRAAKTPFEFQEMATAASTLAPLAKSTGMEIEKLIEQAEILAASNPEQGLVGATFSLREALTGDWASIVERFNLSRKSIKDLRAQGLTEMEIITKAMAEMGYDYKLVDEMANTFQGRMSTFNDTWTMLKGTLTQPFFDYFSDGLGDVNALLEQFSPVMNAAAEGVAKFFGDMLKVIGTPKELFDKLTPLAMFLADNLMPILGAVSAVLSLGFAAALQGAAAAAAPMIAAILPGLPILLALAAAGALVGKAFEGVFDVISVNQDVSTNLNKMAGKLAKNLKDMATGAVEFLDELIFSLMGGGPKIENAAVSAILNPIQQAIKTLQHIAGNWATDVIPVITDALARIPKRLGVIVGLVVPMLLEALGNVGTFLMSAVDLVIATVPVMLRDGGRFILDFIGFSISQISKAIPMALTMVVQGIASLIPRAVQAATGLLEAIYGSWSMGGEGGLWFLFSEGILGGIQQAISTAVDFIVTSAPQLLAGITRLAATLWPQVTNVFNMLGTIFQTIFNSIVYYVSESVIKIGSALIPLGVALYQWIMDAAPKAWAAISTYAATVIANVGSFGGGLVSQLTGWTTALWSWIVTAVPMALEALNTMLTGLIGFLIANLPTWLSTLLEWAMAAVSWIVNAIPGVLTAAGQFLGDLILWVASKLPEWIGLFMDFKDAMIQWIIDSFPGLMANLGEWLGTLLGWLFAVAIPGILMWTLSAVGALLGWIWTDLIPAIPGAIWDFAKSIISALGGIIVGIAKAAWNIGAGIWEAIQKALSPGSDQQATVDAAAAAGQAVVAGVQDGTTAGYPQIDAAATATAQRLANGIDASSQTAIDAARRLGTDMTSGVSQGIEEKIPAVLNAARDMANQAVQAARGQIQAASPSKVFRNEVGATIPEGLALGIIDGTDGVVKAAVRMVEAVHGATKEALRRTGVNQIEVIGRPGSLSASGQMGYQGGGSRSVTSTTVVRNQNITYAPSYTTTPNPSVDLTLARSLAGVNS